MTFLSSIKNTLKEVKFSRPKPIFCPKCKSPELYSNNTYGILPPIYTCHKCGYEGPLFLELDENEKNN